MAIEKRKKIYFHSFFHQLSIEQPNVTRLMNIHSNTEQFNLFAGKKQVLRKTV